MTEQGPEAQAPVEETRAQAPVEETRFQRGIRQTHQAGLYAALVVLVAVLVFLILLIARNTRRVKVDYLFGSTQAQLIWLIVISAITGWVLGIMTNFLIGRRMRQTR